MQVTYLVVTKDPPTCTLHVSHTHVEHGTSSDATMLLPAVRIAVDRDYTVTSVLYADDLFGGRLAEPDDYTTFQECRGGVVVINATNFELGEDELRQVRKMIQRKIERNTKRCLKKKKTQPETKHADKTKHAGQVKPSKPPKSPKKSKKEKNST